MAAGPERLQHCLTSVTVHASRDGVYEPREGSGSGSGLVLLSTQRAASRLQLVQPPVGGSRPQMGLCMQVTAPAHLLDKLWRSVLVVAQPGVQKGVQCAGGNEVKVLQGFGGGQDGRQGS